MGGATRIGVWVEVREFCRVSGLIAARGSALGRQAAFLTLPRCRSRSIASAQDLFGSGARERGRGGAGGVGSRGDSVTEHGPSTVWRVVSKTTGGNMMIRMFRR